MSAVLGEQTAERLRPMVRVAAAVLTDSVGRVLITQRPAGTTMAGSWEFPGGKLEVGESSLGALRRELAEEIGIEALECEPFMEVQHDYPERCVLLSVWRVRHFSGTPTGLEGQALRWVALEALRGVDLLPADWPVVERLHAERHKHF